MTVTGDRTATYLRKGVQSLHAAPRKTCPAAHDDQHWLAELCSGAAAVPWPQEQRFPHRLKTGGFCCRREEEEAAEAVVNQHETRDGRLKSAQHFYEEPALLSAFSGRKTNQRMPPCVEPRPHKTHKKRSRVIIYVTLNTPHQITYFFTRLLIIVTRIS